MANIRKLKALAGCCLRAACLLLMGALCLTTSASGADKEATPAPEAAPVCDCADLLKLSLQELYNLDIVQLNALGAHMHPAGELMFGYQFMYMNMETIRDGTREIKPAEVFASNPAFTVAHIRMEMEEHMFDVMYAPSDRVTLMAMLPYRRMTMLHQTVTGTRFTQHARGIGDLEVMGMVTVLGDIRTGGHRLMLNAGISFPTGSTDVRDHNLGDSSLPRVKLEYPMQLGSGTYDLLPGLTYLGDSGKWAWGVQNIGTIRLGHNSSSYRFGDEYKGSAWVAYGLADWFAPYVRFEGHVWGNIHGRDPAYGAVPRSAEATPDLQAGERINLLLGLNFYATSGWLKGNRITIEGGRPIYERLTGPQLGLDWTINVGWTYGF